MKISHSDFALLAEYVEKHAKGQTLTFNLQSNRFLEVKCSNLKQEEVTISIYDAEDSNGTSFAKISVTRNLGDAVK